MANLIRYVEVEVEYTQVHKVKVKPRRGWNRERIEKRAIDQLDNAYDRIDSNNLPGLSGLGEANVIGYTEIYEGENE